jgi:GNAT superfamily N-acetyltransferase
MPLTRRLADERDIPALRELMALSIDQLQVDVLTPEQVRASHAIMGIDTQLVADGTYFVVERDGELAGCGGWSKRETLYGGDHSAGRNARLLDPETEPARIRAMYTHPDHVRQGVGRLILDLCERAAADAGFSEVEMMATLSGERLYSVCGYVPIEHVTCPPVDGVEVPLIRMRKTLGAAQAFDAR